MKEKIWICLILVFHLAGCATTEGGKGFDLVDDNEYAKALPFFETAATEDGDKVSAVMASFLYLSDYQIPRDVDKAKEYFELAKRLDYSAWQQYLDYFMPLAEARIMLYDDDLDNDHQGNDILRGNRYSEYSPSLGLLAKNYAFGKGVDKNLKVSKLLFERAIEYDDEVYSAHHYAWWLATHPEESFRDAKRAEDLIEIVLTDEVEADRVATLDTLAAVYAENGRFEEAVETQKKAIEALLTDSEEYPHFLSWEPIFRCRLEAYEESKAWHYKLGQMPYAGVAESYSCGG